MRAHDFLTERSIKVEIPINITIPQDGSDPKVSVADKSSDDEKLSPAVQKLVDEHSLDASKIKGTGKDGRLIKEDVQNFLDTHM